MLVSFALTNHACFRDRAELTLEATGSAARDERFTFGTGARRYPRLNRLAAIYGANGSGKSRLVEGLAFMRHFVITSANEGQAGEAIRRTAFLFDAESRLRPTTFEARFIEAGTVFEFGFRVDGKRVVEEWLFAWPQGGRLRRLLHREFDRKAGAYSWTIGASVRGPKKTWRTATRPNALFVSTATQLNAATFRPVLAWFQRLRVIPADGLTSNFTASLVLHSDRARERVVRLLQDADVAVSDVSVKTRTVTIEQAVDILPPAVTRQLIESGVAHFRAPVIRFGHRFHSTDPVEQLDSEEESDGTQRLFALAGPWLDIVDRHRIVVVDELDRSLHPHLVGFLIGLINSPSLDGGEKRAQLVATTHDATLLQDDLDRSQVWFAEKDRFEAARLVPVSDFRPRVRESLMHGYLGGRYGGLPIVP